MIIYDHKCPSEICTYFYDFFKFISTDNETDFELENPANFCIEEKEETLKPISQTSGVPLPQHSSSPVEIIFGNLAASDAIKPEKADISIPKQSMNTTATISPDVLQEIIERVREILPVQHTVSTKVASHVPENNTLAYLPPEENDIEDISGAKCDNKPAPICPSSPYDHTTSSSDNRPSIFGESSAVNTHIRPTPKPR